MKLNQLSDTTKIVLFAATIVVVCILCAVGFKMANEGKSAVNSGTRKYNEMASNQDSTEIAAYDGSTLLGNELRNIIKKTIDGEKYLAIYVRTKTSSVSYNYTYNPEDNTIAEDGIKIIPTKPGDHGYINPDSQFYCVLKKNIDDVIICMDFELVN